MEENNKKLSENTTNGENHSEKQSLGDMFYSNNLDTFGENDKINREYLKEIYGEDMDFFNREIRMTRSEYLTRYNQIQEVYKRELLGTVKSFIFLASIFLLALLLAKAFQLVADEGAVFILHRWTLIISIPIFLFFVVALLKRLKDAQKSMAHSLKMLEKRKNDCMAEGTYDAES